MGEQHATIALLDRYERGAHESVLRELISDGDPLAIKKDLEKLGPAWTRAGGPNQVRRRRLVAATFALEAAYPHFWPEDVDPLVEWGCQLLRQDAKPDDTEHLWLLASVAILERARDDGKLWRRSEPADPLSLRTLPAPRSRDHVAHALQRFPDDPRFRLAEAMMAEVSADTELPRDADWVKTDLLSKGSDEAIRRSRAQTAIQMFEKLVDTPPVRAEAELRSGYLWLTLHEPAMARTHFARAADSSDRFVAYLANFLGGRASDLLGRPAESEAQYRAALAVIPHAQSAATALAANLFLHGRPDEAFTVTQDVLSARPRPDDPWNLFGYGDFRFMPTYIAHLREAIQ
jgi:Flp pilus assembly protein TadD